METESKPAEQPDIAPVRPATLRLCDWIWRPWYAKLWWSTMPVYWAGRAASLKIVALAEFYNSFLAACLAVVFNPLVVAVLLGFGYIKAKLGRGELVITPSTPNPFYRSPSMGGWSDPYTDPLDPRSGARHLRHIGVLKD